MFGKTIIREVGAKLLHRPLLEVATFAEGGIKTKDYFIAIGSAKERPPTSASKLIFTINKYINECLFGLKKQLRNKRTR